MFVNDSMAKVRLPKKLWESSFESCHFHQKEWLRINRTELYSIDILLDFPPI
ncbi:MAG TPA: hypothetical protein VK105_16680 [Virgibacillus sp.]|nr:hypothetical protein [Virgibacillus sp.]HLR68735.1 hypothetical protein [Virgibacillus sp.]